MSTPNQNAGIKPAESKVDRAAIAEVAKRMDARIATMIEENKSASPSTKALNVATAIIDLRQIMNVPEILKLIRALSGSPLGFMCDKPNRKDSSVYTDGELLECCCEALIRGYYLTGNEFNIIAGRFYAAKNGLQRKVYGLDGLENFYPEFSVPVKTNGDPRTHVTVKARFVWKGRQTEMARTFAVNVFDGQASTDAALGKAERKFLAAVWQKLTNEYDPVDDGDPQLSQGSSGNVEVETGESKAEALNKQLNAGTTATAKPTEENQVEEKPKAIEAAKPGKTIFDQIDETEHEKLLRREQEREQHKTSAAR